MAIEWYFALAAMLAKTGVAVDDVFDIVEAWQAGRLRVWLQPVVDPATRLRAAAIFARSDAGLPLAIYARVDGPDLYIFNATHLTAELLVEFEKWEADHHD
ncbi:hypothetical protein [Nocardia heshunensis]